MKIYVVGAGVGKEECLTQCAKDRVTGSEVVVTTDRLYEKFQHLNDNIICLPIMQIADFITKQTVTSVCVLASGDIGFFSIAQTLQTALPNGDFEFISGISSLQYLTAKLGTSYDDAKLISAHGRNTHVIPHVCYNKKVFALTGGAFKAHDVIKELNQVGLGDVVVTVGENLSDSNERIVTDKAKNMLDYQFANLAVMLVQNDNFVHHYERILDYDFIRDKAPMTKEAVRTLTVAELNIKPTDFVVDVGAGSGSVAVEMARKAYEGHIVAIERFEHAVKVIKENIKKFGAYNVEVVEALAPDGLDNLPTIDKAFIGGSAGNLADIVSALLQNNAQIKIVVNAITLETLTETLDVFKQHDFATRISCVNVANAEPMGRYNMMKAENPVYIISGEKSAD